MKKQYLVFLPVLIFGMQQNLQCMENIPMLFSKADEINSKMAMLLVAANKLNAKLTISANTLSSNALAPHKKGKKRARKETIKVSKNKATLKKRCIHKQQYNQPPAPTFIEEETIACGVVPSQIQENVKPADFTINPTYVLKRYESQRKKNVSAPVIAQLSSEELINIFTTSVKTMKIPLLMKFLFEPVNSTYPCLLQQAINSEKFAEFKIMLLAAAQRIAVIKTVLFKIKNYHDLGSKIQDALVLPTIQNHFTRLVNFITRVISQTSKKSNPYARGETDEKGRSLYLKTVGTNLNNLLVSPTMPSIESLGATEEK